jgi:hypothetical protein
MSEGSGINYWYLRRERRSKSRDQRRESRAAEKIVAGGGWKNQPWLG